LFILDAGSGIRALGQHLLSNRENEPLTGSVFISHFHWDHIMGIPFFMPLYHPNSHYSFFSFRHPHSSFQEVIEAQMNVPYFPVPMKSMAGERAFYEIGEQSFEVGDCLVTTRRLNHPQGCLGYRFDDGHAAFTYATDHEPDGGPFDRNLFELAHDADMLVLDAQYTPVEYEGGRRGWGHGTWESALQIAREASVKRLVLFHHDPDRTDLQLSQIVEKARKQFPALDAASEGWEVRLSRTIPVARPEKMGALERVYALAATPPIPRLVNSVVARTGD